MSDRFKAVTWNLYAGTPKNELGPILKDLCRKDVSLFLMQEAREEPRGLNDWLKGEGLATFVHKQYRVAWNPEEWVRVSAGDVRLSNTHFFEKDGTTPIYSEGARVILSDYQGRTLEVVSYHTPAHVQGEEKKASVPNRYAALIETMVRLGHMADDSECRAVLFGGDDNWDEDTGFQTRDTTPILLGESTGLRQVQSKLGTHGRRDIDDFRIKRKGGIKPVGESWVQPGGGDHKVHGREFKWRS